MIIQIPLRGANDNAARQYWTCYACQNAAFLLEWEAGKTTIHCAVCHTDLTPYIVPELEKSKCQP